MNKVILKTRKSLERGYTTFSITKMMLDRECLSTVKKRFMYRITKGGEQKSEIKVRTLKDRKINLEQFTFRVKGAMKIEEEIIKYCHSLKISLHWAKEIPNDNKNIKAL